MDIVLTSIHSYTHRLAQQSVLINEVSFCSKQLSHRPTTNQDEGEQEIVEC